MKRNVFLAVVAVLALSGVGVLAQSESFVGIVKAVNGATVTVEHGSITGVFSFDAKTHVSVRGATAKTQEVKDAGKPGLTVPDVVHAGDQVKVTYTYTASTNKMVVGDIAVLASLTPKK